MAIVDIVLVVAVLLLFLVILGVMRETVILDGKVTALSQLITKPPAPSILRKSIPNELAQKLSTLHEPSPWAPRVHIILFLRATCGGCEDVVARLDDVIKRRVVSRDNISCVVAADSEETSIFHAARSISRDTVLDASGSLFDACEIRGAPTQLAIWTDTLRVFDYNLGGDVEWIRQKLQQRQETVVATSAR